MNFLNCFFVALLLAPALFAADQNEFTFDPIFIDGMVLQRGPATMIYGQGPANKTATITFQGKKTRAVKIADGVKADPITGRWRASLDLSSLATLFGEPGLDKRKGASKKLASLVTEGEIKITWSKSWANNVSISLSNVLIGDIWLVAGWDGQGVKGQWLTNISDATITADQVRFWDLNQRKDLTSWPNWEVWPKGDNVRRFPNIALRVAIQAMNKESSYVGIVLMPGPDLEKAIADPTNVIADCVLNNSNWLNLGVVEAQAARRRDRIASKHSGIATDIQEITNYDAPVFRPYAAFFTNQFPAQKFTFEGAMMPAHAAALRPQGAPEGP